MPLPLAPALGPEVTLKFTVRPAIGVPELASVTVMAESSMRADALATGLMVLGPEGARTLAEREDIAALFILRGDGGFREEWTPEIDGALSGGAAHER